MDEQPRSVRWRLVIPPFQTGGGEDRLGRVIHNSTVQILGLIMSPKRDGLVSLEVSKKSYLWFIYFYDFVMVFL